MIGLNKVKGVLYALLFAGFATVLLYSCRMSEKPKPIISVTIQPQKYFAEKLVGDRFIINCVVPQGGNPEAYDPTPSHLVQVGKSVAYWRIRYAYIRSLEGRRTSARYTSSFVRVG